MACINCTWSKANHTNVVAASLTCENYTERLVAERNAGMAFMPERCPKCDEHLTPRVTKGAYQCKCDQPKPPRSVLEAANLAPLPGVVRYGGR